MPLSERARNEIKTYLQNVVVRFINQSLTGPIEKPFHVRLMPLLGEVRFSERSFSTRSGSWFQRIALMVAKDFHHSAASNHLVTGNIQPAAEAHINAIVEEMDHGRPKRKPNRERDISEVLTVQSGGGTNREIRSDLFVETRDGRELYFEMKTPGPNKGQCKGMKRDILLISALRKGNNSHAFAAAAYNPYGDGKPYIHNYALQFLEVSADMLIGRSFWTMIGDAHTYDELLDISTEVGEAVKPILANILEKQ
jgi:hypothetical protein